MILIWIAVCLSGCGTNPNCGWVKAIYISKEDSLTRGTKQQLLTHNETWEKNK
jgi:hypothetical protein